MQKKNYVYRNEHVRVCESGIHVYILLQTNSQRLQGKTAAIEWTNFLPGLELLAFLQHL